jgi:hypothetical protein
VGVRSLLRSLFPWPVLVALLLSWLPILTLLLMRLLGRVHVTVSYLVVLCDISVGYLDITLPGNARVTHRAP